MAKYRKVDPRIWNDAKFRQLSDNAKLVFFMLLTHPNMTALGAMRATISGLSEELGWEVEAFRKAFREALSKGMAEHDQKACLVALPNFLRYNPPESPNVVKAWMGSIDLLPECELKSIVIKRSKGFAKGMNKAFAEALPEAFGKAMPYQEQEPEQEQELTPKRDAGRFGEFWSAWPKHRIQDKKKCGDKWRREKLDALADTILSDIEIKKNAAKWLKDGGAYVEYPLVYLNNRRWEDGADIESASAEHGAFV